jgi:hypothetical protein
MAQKIPRAEPRVELDCFGLHVKATGSLAVILVVLLVAGWMALARLHLS